MRNRSTAATIARALLALVALVALVAGVPAVLLGIGVLPDHVPGVGEITTALTSPDTGQLFLGAVTLIGWYGWISFVISVVLETGAALRHVRAPRIRMLGGSQQLAGALVGGILILLPAGTAMATPATAAPAASATAATASVSAGTQTETPAPASSTWRGPVHHVQDGDTLWDIAEKRLGAGIEWHRIVDANDGVRQADGSLVTADTTVLQPGWILRLPADASPAPSADQGGARTQTAGSKAASETHTVRAGETLTGIAEDELGDADAYPRIVEANKGVEQDDGRALGDPDEIYPGWELKIPAAAGSDPSDSKPDQAQPPREQPADQGKAEERPGAEQTQPPAQEKPGPGADQGEKGETAQTPGQGSDQDSQDGGQPTEQPSEQPPAQNPAPDREREQHGTPTQAPEAHDTAEAADSGDQSVQSIAAAGSILAAAVLAVVAARRARQQRRRRPKRRIPMPSGATADFEKQLRVASDITGAALADRALRTLAANCRQAGRPLPEVEAMRITARGIELHLAAVTPTVAPFTEHETKPTAWVCPARGAALLNEDEAADITVPYPALVSLGETEDGDTVLVNLEAIGLLRLAGSPADVRAVMLALAVELASSRLAPDTQIVLAGAGSDLHHLYPDQIEHHADLGPATTDLQAHDAFQRQALIDGGHDHLRAARLGEDGGDTWIPRILIATAPPTGPAAAELEDLLASRPRTSVAVVTAAGGELDLPGAWTLPAQPGTLVELPDLDLAVKLQHLDADSYDRLVQLIATSSRTDDVPPPPWTGHTGPADTNGPRSTVPVGEDSALAPETTAAPAVTTAVATQGSGLATALPAFTAFSPALTPDEGPADRGSSDGWEEEQDGSALSPAVAGSPTLDKQPDEDADSNFAGEPTGWEVPEPAEDDGAPEETSALGAEVWDTAEPEQDFETVLGEVLGERDDDSPVPPDGEEAGSGLSAAALGDGPDEEESPEDGSALADDKDDAESGLTAAAFAVTAPAATATEARIIPRPSAATSTVLAALATPPAEPEGPQVQVLGPVTLTGAQGRVGSNRHNHLLEIAAWLVLHPGLGRQDLDNAIWPGLRKTSSTRNTAISRLRSWLGPNPHLPADDPQGAYLPAVTEGVYRLGPAVTSDWDRFKELYQQGMHHDGQDADVALAHALALVRGRPFADVDPSKYCWAEADIQEMISAIVDVAHELAERRRQVRDYRAAAQAVTKGMLVDSQSELLYRDLFTICHEMGDREGLERAAAQLARINMEEGVDSSPETVGLLRTLLKGERIKPTLGSAAS
ncbi:LysM peptidoglycan-binding domain-containing protein (plasmid) [Streptomyces sp. BB1-1-1]|uniref:LysM peptidoglycan-binding domain-containing protein n=1 Tax=Streptomyces sp. BB1-1-1 TaxID=3074430 RepID=UPI002877E658|nr:LysM peptidoglycan-binding domain-containing protein [Streptomyces sp. BB1-1-1]WND40685.1 LysM peptidoglycan-binding domain-containing protein [Streptomyces sp. BB1-1-1]